MRLSFHGAAGVVTGSCYLLETANSRVLVDCGMFQGSKNVTRLNYEPFNFDASKIQYLLLTHAHIDHSGLIPKLVKHGFRGRIFATRPTVDLAKIMLEDSANIAVQDTEHENKRRLRAGLPPRKPLYGLPEVKAACKLFTAKEYDARFDLTNGIAVRFQDAGHILGSAIVEVWVTEAGKTNKIVFSGDLGQTNTPIVPDPTPINDADFVVVESTYGDRLHADSGIREELFAKEVNDTFKKGGKLMIPSFAIERTQELLYYLKRMERDKRLPAEKVFLDSPLAIKATEVFKKNMAYAEPELKQEFSDPFNLRQLTYLKSTQESKSLNEYKRPCIIIAGSGMCTAGRIRHHLKHNLWKPENTVLFVGYQAEGTLGRLILEGAKTVRMMGTEVAVKSRVSRMESFSSHADSRELLNWMTNFTKTPKKVFVTHGEPDAANALAAKLNALGFKTYIPALYEQTEIK